MGVCRLQCSPPRVNPHFACFQKHRASTLLTTSPPTRTSGCGVSPSAAEKLAACPLPLKLMHQEAVPATSALPETQPAACRSLLPQAHCSSSSRGSCPVFCPGDGPTEEERLRLLDGYLSTAAGVADLPLPPVPAEKQWQVEAQPLFKARGNWGCPADGQGTAASRAGRQRCRMRSAGVCAAPVSGKWNLAKRGGELQGLLRSAAQI